MEIRDFTGHFTFYNVPTYVFKSWLYTYTQSNHIYIILSSSNETFIDRKKFQDWMLALLKQTRLSLRHVVQV
jgi:hypothetical protein